MAKKVKAGTTKASAETRKVAFVEAYLSNGRNATAAALTAGYSKGGAAKQGYRMSKDPSIMSMIAARQAEIERKIGLTTERTLQELARLAYSDPRKLYHADGRMKAIHELDDDSAACVAMVESDEITVGEQVIGNTKKLKVWDKNSALDKAMKFHGLYERDNEQQKPAEVPMDLTETARRIAFILAKATRGL